MSAYCNQIFTVVSYIIKIQNVFDFVVPDY